MSAARTDNTELFARMPVARAVVTLVIPTVISQMITVVYNMADTFFIGQMNDPAQVAAATLSMPPFVLLTGIANLFGIGGSSLIARSLGVGDTARARRAAAFSMWTAALVALVYGVMMYVFRPVVFPVLGADKSTFAYCEQYILWTIAVGGVPTVLSACLAHLMRAEGYAKEASFGVALGGVLNIALDPLLIFGMKLGVAGAAIATMLSNAAATAYFLILMHQNRAKLTIRISPKYYAVAGAAREVLLVGMPSFVMMLMGVLSNLVLNRIVVSYSNEAIAGMGIAKKIDMLAFAIANGMTQGVLPLIAYNFAAKNGERMRAAIRTAFAFSLMIAGAGAVLLFTCAVPVVRLFIADAATVSYGQHFLRVISVTCPCVSVTMMVIAIFQATGEKRRPMVLSFLRKGGLDVPFMLMLHVAVGAAGIPFATAIADVLAMSTALALFLPYWKRMRGAM